MSDKTLEVSWASPPSDTIKNILEERNLEKIDLYDALGFLYPKGESFLRDEISITDEIARKLASFFGTSKEFWINRYTRYERAMRNRNCRGI